VRSPPILLVIIVVSLSSGAHAGNRFWDDAGSGRDAGSTSSTAVALASWGGPWSGYAWSGDVDVYGLPAVGTPGCVESSISGGSQGSALLQFGSAAAGVAFDRSTTTWAVASMEAARPWLTVIGEQTEPGAVGDHTFTTASFPLQATTGDAGAGVDAGAGATALSVDAGCVAGSVGGLDVVDEFDVAIEDGGRLVLSVVATSSSLAFDVIAPTGAKIASLSAGESVDLTGLPAGSYTLSAPAVGLTSVDYVLGIAAGPPGCKPNC
jgi:hypothetical protein